MARRACCGAPTQAFPQSLERLPVLPPTGHSVLRQTLDRWFREQGIHPNVVGEFEDSALMSVFAARGWACRSAGWAATISAAARPAAARRDAVHEEIHAIRNRRGQNHPLVRRILEQAKTSVFLNVCHIVAGFSEIESALSWWLFRTLEYRFHEENHLDRVRRAGRAVDRIRRP